MRKKEEFCRLREENFWARYSSLHQIHFKMFLELITLESSSHVQGGFAKVFAGTLAGPHRAQYAIKIVAKCSLQKVRAQQKVRIIYG